METCSADTDLGAESVKVKVNIKEPTILDNLGTDMEYSARDMGLKIRDSENVADSDLVEKLNQSERNKMHVSLDLAEGLIIIGDENFTNGKGNFHSGSGNRSSECESELSSVSTYTTVIYNDDDLNEANCEAGNTEVAKNEERFYEELGLVHRGLNYDSSTDVVEAINIKEIVIPDDNRCVQLNYGNMEYLHEELQLFSDVVETNVESTMLSVNDTISRHFKELPGQSSLTHCNEDTSRTTSDVLSQNNFHNANEEKVADSYEVTMESVGGYKPNLDNYDRNSSSSEEQNDVDIKIENDDGVSQMTSGFAETVPMTCAQFLLLVNKEDYKNQPPDESELAIFNSNESTLKRLDTIVSMEGDEDVKFENVFEENENDNNIISFLNASSGNNNLPLQTTVNILNDKTISDKKSVVETPVRRKSTGIFIKKHEKEGRSRSPSPVPRRYRKNSTPMQKHPLVVVIKNDNKSDIELAPVHSKGNSNFTGGNSTVKHETEKGNNSIASSVFSKPVSYSAQKYKVGQQDEEGDESNAQVGLLESYKSSPTRRRMKSRCISGGSVSDDDIPSVHKPKPIEVNVKGKKVIYEIVSCQGVVSPEAPNDDFGVDPKAKKGSKVEKFFTNEDIFTNKAVLAAYAQKKLRALRNSFRRERKRTISSGSESASSEPTRRRLESQSSLVLKLTERDDFNRDVIEGFIEPIKLPPKKQRTFSSGDENCVSADPKPKVIRSQRSRSHGHLGQTVPVTVRIPSVLVEPWRGAWDHTVLRIVEPNDTLASVAAHFDITPSELAILNRLPSRTVFPGQVIRVPDKRRRDPDSEDKENKQDNPDDKDKGGEKDKGEDKSEVCDEEMDMLEKLRLTSPKPGHAERVRTPLSPTPDPTHQRFLKINVRHITDGQGVVSGVLLVTSNAVMFDPNVSDPLVIEHGPESYGVIAPMEYVVNVAIYHDIAHMRVGSHDQFRPDWPKPEVYHLKEPFPPTTDAEGEGSSGTLLTINQGDSLDSGDPHHSPSAREDSLLAKDETFPELRSSTEDEEEEDVGSLCSCSVPREGDAFPKAFDRDLVTPTNLSTTTEKQESEAEDPTPKNESVALIRSLEERRKSSLDHHWAVPSKVRSLEEQSASVSDTQVMDNNRRNSEGLLVKLSCHDSGIDIRDPPPPVVPQVPRKSTYSDADVLLSDEFVPPVPIQPIRPTSGAAVSFSLDQSHEGRTSSESHDGINLREKDDQEKETKKNKMLKRLSYPLSWMEGLSGDKDEKESLPSSAESHPPSSHSASSSVFSKVFSRRSSVGTFIRQQHQPHPSKDKSAAPKLDYRSMVSVEDMPELFVSFDKLIPRPAQSCDDPPLYLRLRMGKPKNKKIPKSTPIMSYGKKKMRPEYWFSVPRERVDDLYRFLMVWVPQLYGDLEEATVSDRGYELVDSDTELWETEDTVPRPDGRRGSDDDDIADLTRESWEVLSMSEELRRALYASSSLDLELCVPDLNGVTEILSEEHRKQLCHHLPARAEGYVWTLVFSTSQHGFSLNSMYRKMTRVESPILMVIQDTENNVFGALTSCALKMSDHFYGTGESLLFRFAPDCQVYNWTGDNMYFIKGNNESLSIGAGDGKFGLWLDGDLYQGRTEPCNTYGNDPLTPSVDFVVKTLECWAFI